MNQNDCKRCEGWGCSYCQPRNLGEQVDTELLELDRRVAAAVKAEREACCEDVRSALTTGLLTPGNVLLAIKAIRARGGA